MGTNLDAPAIVAAALDIADRDGLDAVTMRRVAGQLGVTPMALYYHVPNKEHLVDLIADAALEQAPQVDSQGVWETELERYFVGLHRRLVEHPALAEVVTRRPLEGPNALRFGEQLLALLVSTGLDDDDVVEVFILLFNYTIGAALYSRSHDPPPQRFADVTRDDAPNTYRLRKRLAQAGAEEHFIAGVRRIIATIDSRG